MFCSRFREAVAMVHHLRTAATPSSMGRAGWGALERLLRRLNPRKRAGYRPELHYMRGGQTSGAKSLAAA
jgi:hypothetical protein